MGDKKEKNELECMGEKVAFKAHLKHSNEKSMDKLLSNLDKKK